jgi:hypothetical protein
MKVTDKEKSGSAGNQDGSAVEEKENPTTEQDQGGGDDTQAVDAKALIAKRNELLAETKKAKAKAAELEAEVIKLRADKAKAVGDYKTLYEESEKARLKAETQAGKIVKATQNSVKMAAVLESLPGKVDKKYYNLLETFLPEIQVEGLDEVDEGSVRMVADKFQKLFPEIITKSGTTMPQDAAKGSGGKPSLDAYKSLNDPKKMREELPKLYEAMKAGTLKI